MYLLRKIVLISVCISLSSAFATKRSIKDINYQIVETNIEEEFDENGNPIFKTVIKIEDSLKLINDNFNIMREQFIEDQGNIFDAVRDNIEEYKSSRDYDLKLYKEKIDRVTEKYYDIYVETLRSRKLEIEENIASIQSKAMDENSELSENMRMTEEEYRNKLEKLNDRKYSLTALMTQHCDDCDETLREYKLDVELAQNDKDITELQQKFLKQSEENEKKLKEFNTEKAGELIVKYSQLVDLLKRELEMHKKRESIIEQKDRIISEWKAYSENIENLHTNVRSKIEDLTSNSIDVQNLISGIEKNETKQDSKKSSSSFNWVPFEENSMTLPENAVTGCEDIDGSSLYVIRKKRGNSYLYGKYAFSDERKNAYITNDEKEYGISHFEILTATNYSWCETNSFDIHDLEYPICKASYKNSTVPGTLLEDGTCRIGFEWGVKFISDDFYILTPGQCSFQQIQY